MAMFADERDEAEEHPPFFLFIQGSRLLGICWVSADDCQNQYHNHHQPPIALPEFESCVVLHSLFRPGGIRTAQTGWGSRFASRSSVVVVHTQECESKALWTVRLSKGISHLKFNHQVQGQFSSAPFTGCVTGCFCCEFS